MRELCAAQCCRWLCFWILMQRRCHHCGKRHSVAPTAWASGSSHIFAQCKQQTADTSVHIYLRVCGCMCRSVNMNRQRAAIVSPMVSLRLTQAGGGLVWNVIYLQRASPSASACCVKTKIFIESPTLLRYLLTTSSSHCLVAVVLMRCFFSFLSSYLTSAGCNLTSDRSAIVPVLVFQVIFSSVFSALFDW